MAGCECLATCIFFNDKMANMPGTADLYKARYCKKDNTNCARYMVFKAVGKTKVPTDLFPNDVEKVKGIIAAGKRE